ncbi:protein MgtR [Citrobacter amalonaticus]|uniref:Protein MgtR n=1 Tax=Citrobacter amalonaticus TaxID=35703 RepID=A0A2S4RS57_CITAM|nr:protein MgtR [Citrobacter amalonaticus]POT55713.1 protein MgtR [Citrobacter amalonaticus]POT73926.1 protein MgtR [Citrobacter amalonaticus]POU62301.1 protein MgtR [Citrobacter amalonaticus]POV02803.1 protein MgtR [Citrobacter amalonaticus]
MKRSPDNVIALIFLLIGLLVLLLAIWQIIL